MNQITEFKRAYERRCHTQFRRALDRRFGGESWARKMQEYRNYPARFAREVLGTTWWAAQERVARSLVQYRRVAVKSGNGVGKTFLAADLALWFLYCHRPAVVITSAPTWRQVRHLLWQEIRKRVRSARVRLPGKLLTTRLEPGEGWFALGLSADKDVRFQGFHAENLLVIFDEASGIPDDIWDAAEAVAVGFNNRILAIGNPLIAEGRFYRAFQRPGWLQITINAMHHPNITGKGQEIPGCVTREYLEERIADWCEPTESNSISSASSPGGAPFNSQILWFHVKGWQRFLRRKVVE